MSTLACILAGLGVIEAGGVFLAYVFCKAAARRPLYGPPLKDDDAIRDPEA